MLGTTTYSLVHSSVGFGGGKVTLLFWGAWHLKYYSDLKTLYCLFDSSKYKSLTLFIQ